MENNQNENLENVPPLVGEEIKKYSLTKIKVIGGIILFLIIFSRNYYYELDSLLPFGRYLWIFFVILFLFYVIFVSKKIDNGLKTKNTSMAEEYNKYGDSVLFESAKKDNGIIFLTTRKKFLIIVLIPSTIMFLTFGITSLYLTFFENLKELLIFGIGFTIISLGTFLFWFEDKRVFTEAKRRNEFIEQAEKIWKISKNIYFSIIFVSIVLSVFLIINNMDFLKKTYELNYSKKVINYDNLIFRSIDKDGNLNLGEIGSIDNLVLPEKIIGDINLSKLTSAKKIVLPKFVGGRYIDISSLVSVDELILPEESNSLVILRSINNTKNLIIPESFSGSLGLYGITSEKDLILPKIINCSLIIPNLISIDSLVLPENVSGEIDLSGLISIKNLVLPKSVGGNINLDNLVSIENLILPDFVGGYIYLSKISQTEIESIKKQYPQFINKIK